MYCSIWSVNSIRPTLSLLRMAEKASTLASSAASSRLLCARRAEIARGADVHEQQDRQLAFLGEFLDERAAGAGGDVPVNGPHFVAGDVFAHLVEVHAPALEDRVVFAGQGVVDEAAGADFELPHPAQDVAWLCSGFMIDSPFQVRRRIHGTGSVSRIFWMMSSEVMFSASAS